MRILITGINGFIGQHLAIELLKRGHAVIGLGRNKKSAVLNITKYYSGSVLDKKVVGKAVSGADAIVHLAALTAHKDIIENRFEALEINLTGTKNILDAYTKSKTAKKFLYSSTGKVYGEIQQVPITEDHPTKPLNILGKSKLIAEHLIDFYNDKQKAYIILRVFNIYGPQQKKNFLVPTILEQLHKKELVLGDIDAKRDYVYISDLIDAFVLALEKNIPKGISIFNIGTGIGTSAAEIVKHISDLKKVKFNIKSNKELFRSDEMKDEYGSYEKVQRELGWKPKVTLNEGLKRVLDL
jgi:nucleoside-diphosphate-sugar epimerase